MRDGGEGEGAGRFALPLSPTPVGPEVLCQQRVALVLATPPSGRAARWQVAQPVSEMGVPPRRPQGAVETSATAASKRIPLFSGSELLQREITMRRLFAFEFVTLDGLFEGPEPWSLEWHNVDGEFNDFIVAHLERVDLLLYGRRTYEGMARYWPTEAARTGDPVVARVMNETAKIVFSKSLELAAWENTRVVTGNCADEVRRLKTLPGKDMAIQGSSDLTVSLLGLGLVDEIHLMVNPVLLGAGRRLFGGLKAKRPLRLLRSQPFRSGNVLLCYAVDPQDGR